MKKDKYVLPPEYDEVDELTDNQYAAYNGRIIKIMRAD